ncbi:discoidin domain-containing protein [Candidatus Woesearchaeota archaeon]|nr:hypothetical protein [uncultured archaeon]AQS32266.1 hypothetical protein [uncultured archaeon]MBS3149383.1 discoidin domain-containing protein [Candidatus Woesearchaeota archaeon]
MKKSIFLVFLISIILFVSACQQAQQQPDETQKSCSDECSSESCTGSNFISCTTSSEGCKVKSDEGLVKGKCNVECLSTFDCQLGYECGNNFKCQKKVEQKPKDTLSLCGNGNIDSGETCSNCQDVECSSSSDLKTSCINNICKPYDKRHFDYHEDIRKYCGYTFNDFNPENIALKVVDSMESCSLQINDEVTATSKQLFDGYITYPKNQWSCGTQSSTPISMPQYATIQLDKEYVISKFTLVQNSAAKDDNRNVADYSIGVSTDSTNGKNGYWRTIYEGKLQNRFQSKKEILFPPTSAKWVKLNVNSLYNSNSNIFTLAELQIFEARFLCVGDKEK